MHPADLINGPQDGNFLHIDTPAPQLLFASDYRSKENPEVQFAHCYVLRNDFAGHLRYEYLGVIKR